MFFAFRIAPVVRVSRTTNCEACAHETQLLEKFPTIHTSSLSHRLQAARTGALRPPSLWYGLLGLRSSMSGERRVAATGRRRGKIYFICRGKEGVPDGEQRTAEEASLG